MEALRNEGVRHVAYSDPHVPTLRDESSPDEAPLASVDLTPDAIADHDVVVILTDHDAFPYDMIVEHASAVIDTRNALGAAAQERATVRLLGGGNGPLQAQGAHE
jgi:UDP-N-acetyl-D-glucosamine dehydrogenase